MKEWCSSLGVWGRPGGFRKEQHVSTVLENEGAFPWWAVWEGPARPRQVLGQTPEVFEEWTQLDGVGSWCRLGSQC